MEEELQGIEIAQIIQNTKKTPFIFLTAHSDLEIVTKALDTNPISYLTKPFKKMDIFAALNLLLKTFAKKQNEFLVFKEGPDTIRLRVLEIMYAESSGNYIKVHTAEKVYVLRNSLDWLSQQISSNQFVKAHRSFLVNKEKISKNIFEKSNRTKK